MSPTLSRASLSCASVRTVLSSLPKSLEHMRELSRSLSLSLSLAIFTSPPVPPRSLSLFFSQA